MTRVKELSLPPEAYHNHWAFLGKTGSGKTYAAKSVVERLLAEGRRVCIVDPTSAWWGLKSSADGKKAGFPVVIFGGEHADVPITENAGEALGELIGTRNLPAVIDVQQMTVGARTRFFASFAGAIYRHNKGPLHLVIDEAHNFAPQGRVPDPDAGAMLHATANLASAGRSRGIRLTMITQRPAKLHKDVLTQAEVLIAMRLIAPQDRKAVEEWIDGCGDPKAGASVLDSLATLGRGEGWVWAPEFGVLERLMFPKITTFDSSRTPDDGETIAEPAKLAQVDLAGINDAVAAAVKEAAENDPKKLRAKVADLQAQLKKSLLTPVSVAPDELLECRRQLEQRMSGIKFVLQEVQAAQEHASIVMNRLGLALAGLNAHAHPNVTPPQPSPRAPSAQATRPARDVPTSPASASGLTGPQQKVIDALAWWASIDVFEPSRVQIGFIAGYTATSGTFRTLLSECKSLGLIEYAAGGTAVLTTAGTNAANLPQAPASLDLLHRRIRDRLSGPQVKIFDFLAAERLGAETTREQLAEATGYQVTSGTFRTLLSECKSLGIVKYPSPRTVQASELLFPAALVGGGE